MTAKRRLRSRPADRRQMALPLPPAERYKLFLAAMPPTEVAQQFLSLAERLQTQFGLSVAIPIPHVKLYGLGDHDDIPKDIIEAVRLAVDVVRVRSFEAAFDGVQPFGGPRQERVLRCGKGLYGFVALQNAIGNAQAGADRPFFNSKFTPHLTPFYGGGQVLEMALDEPIAWHVEKFSLILSLQGHKHYEPYGEWPLQG